MLNYWPTADMDVYLKLESRVQARMALADLAASGGEDPFTEEDAQLELNFRDEQLLRLRDEVLDLDDLSDSPTMGDFTLDHFLTQLLRYLEANKDALEAMPPGVYAVSGDRPGTEVQPGAIFFLRQRNAGDAGSRQRAAKRAGIVESTGRGIDTIFYEQLRNGRAAPSYERSTETGVTLALAGGEPNLGLVRLVAEEGRSPIPLSLEDLLVLTALEREGRMTALNAAAVLQREEVAAQDVLKRLEGRGLVSGQGAGERRWHQLSEEAARRIGDGAGDQRRRVEPAGHGDLVRRYIEEHGSISRTVAANLCDITNPQAYRLLNRLVSEAVLRRVGTRGRNVRYEKNE